MRPLLDLTRRVRRPELMDDPTLAAPRHTRALRDLARLNRWSRSVGIVWAPIEEIARRNGGATLRVLDLATGAGDVPIGLWHRARRTGLPIEIDGCDSSPGALAHARQAAAFRSTSIRFFQLDALRDPLPAGYDVITSSLFLHHLDDEPAAHLLRRMAAATCQAVLVNDLRRTRLSLVQVYLGARVLCRSDVVHHDAVLSVQAAFTLDEARGLARAAGLQDTSVTPRWPCRFLLQWNRG